MPRLVIVNRSGEEETVTVSAGISVMEAIRDFGYDELLAPCGGCCSCATCHVYVDQVFSDRMPAMTADENDLLDSSEHRTDNSRLSCQLTVKDGFDGVRIVIAPED
ncbi:MAG: 2Fe-2S iron-sulfur cluster-binding protein [Novosphingobium sp.]